MGKINVAELLKDCPKGMELDCTMWDGVTFEEIQPGNYPIKVKIKGDEDITTDFTEFGEWNYLKNSKCVIFPTGKTTWEGFVPPCKFKDGDIVATSKGDYVFMLKKVTSYRSNSICDGTCYCAFGLESKKLLAKEAKKYFSRLATEEEKQKLFDAIKENGYKWNEETKTLEKLVEPYTEQIKETMEPITIDDFKANTKEWLIDKLESMSKDNALQAICNIHDELHKPQYPKTFEECCTILGLTELGIIGGYRHGLLTQFRNLLICRDAYWKIAGEQMGLGKPWVPDWPMYSDLKHCIIYSDNEIKWRCKSFVTEAKILAFPTEEMRDAFYEHFEELIKECKSLL